jgi:uncharacterized protein
MSPFAESVAAPVAESERLQSLDALRGVALFGILLMNITGFGLPYAYDDPTNFGGATGANLWAWITTNMVFEGTQRGLFSLLFGAGFVSLATRRESAGSADAADLHYRRMTLMVVFGMIHSYLLLWTGEILFFYGIVGMFLYPLRKLSPRVLFTMAAIGFSINIIWGQGERLSAIAKYDKFATAQKITTAGGKLSKSQEEDTKAWKEFVSDRKPDAEKIKKQIDAHQGSYLGLVVHQAPDNARGESWGVYRWFFDMFSMMLIGMALFRTGVLTLAQPSRVYWLMLLIGYSVGLSINYWETRTIIESGFTVFAFLQTNLTYDLGRLAMTMGHVGLLLLFCRSGYLSWLRNSLAAVGRMAFTNYISHSIICALVFSGFGLGLYGKLDRHQLYYVVLSIWLFQLIASPIWLRYFLFGPLEWGWRSLTYLKKQPFRRITPVPVLIPEPAA